jgi:hypothetical protein
MTRNLLGGFSGFMFLAWSGIAWADDIFLPAGTLLRCILDEPNLSAKTAEEGDPVLCRANAVVHVGRTVFPTGTYVGARLAAYNDPGHFFGKGYLRLEFDRIGLPNAEMPVSAKVIAARGYQVNRQGNIVGRGHAKRDVAQWLLPPLWPWKVVTLPLRGPRPVLGGEVPITVRLMEAVMLPQTSGSPLRNSGNTPAIRPSPSSFRMPNSSSVTYLPPSMPSAERQVTEARAMPLSAGESSSWTGQQAAKLTLLAFKDKTIFGTTDYWIDNGRLFYILSDGTERTTDLGEVDWGTTSQLNSERGVRIAVRTGRRTY